MDTLNQQTVGQIVADDYRKAKIFNKYDIDFCCNGDISVQEACDSHDIETDELLAELENIEEKDAGENNYNNWDLGFLADYIINNHHQYLREIEAYADTVAEVHGKDHEELPVIYKEFLKLSNTMKSHMDEEEGFLFPFIKDMEASGEDPIKDIDIDSSELIEMMEDEHDEVGNSIKKINKLSKNYLIPEDACPAYRTLYENLAVLDDDLHKHIHLENNILFPKALKLMHHK